MGTTPGNWESMDMSQVLPPRAELNRCSPWWGWKVRRASTRAANRDSRPAGGTCREGKVLPLGVKSKLLGSSGLMLAVKLSARLRRTPWRGWSAGRGPEAYGQFELGLTVLTMAAMFSRLGLDAVMVKLLAATRVDGHVGMQRTLARRASMWVLGASLLLAGGLWWGTTWLQESLGGDEGLWTAVAWGVPAMALWGLASEMLRGLGRMAGYASVQQGVLTALAVALMLSLGGRGFAFGAALLAVGGGRGPGRMVLAHRIQGHRNACLIPGERHVVHGVAHVARVGHVLGHELDGHLAVGPFLGRG